MPIQTNSDSATPRARGRRPVDITNASPETAIAESQAAEIVGYATITLTQRRLRGDAPPHFKIGRSVRYRLGDVLAWRDARMVGRQTANGNG
jgi:predicted DNA-binding transcriptional regulator AlpA